jgi:hypothetical protein
VNFLWTGIAAVAAVAVLVALLMGLLASYGGRKSHSRRSPPAPILPETTSSKPVLVAAPVATGALSKPKSKTNWRTIGGYLWSAAKAIFVLLFALTALSGALLLIDDLWEKGWVEDVRKWLKEEGVAGEEIPGEPLTFDLAEWISSGLGVIPPSLWIFVLLILLLGSIMFTGRARLSAIVTLGVIIATIVAFGPHILWTEKADVLDRGINHGDWSAPEGYTKRVIDGTVTIGRGGSDRFVATGTVKIRNGSNSQCVHIQPDSDHVSIPTGNGFVVEEKGSGHLIYTISWKGNTWDSYVTLAPGRTETITVTTIPIGYGDCIRT